MTSVDNLLKRQSSIYTEKLRDIKSKLEPDRIDFAFRKIDNELITDHFKDVEFILQKKEEFDWNVPVPFDKEEMWQERQQKAKIKNSPSSNLIETSIMAVARQKYSDYTLQKVASKNLQTRQNDMAVKLDILRQSGHGQPHQD